MKLSDVCFEMHQGINTVADKVKYYECGTPILQSKNITNGILDLEDVRFVDENDYNKYKERYIPHKGNILLSNIGTIGKSLLIDEEKDFLIAWNIFLIKVNESKINSKFLNFYFQYLDMSNYYNKYLTGGTVKFINKKTMENIEIPNISLVNQIKIAEELEKVQKMIDIREKQIKKLDELIKSQFLEMFGDININDKKWNEDILKNNLSVVGGYAFKSSEFQENGIPILRIGNINTGQFRPKDLMFWKEEKSLENYAIYPDDVLMSLTGTVGKEDYGNICIIGNEYPKYYLNQRNAKLNIKETLKKEYISYALRVPEIKRRLTGISRGVRQANISNKDIENLKLPIPPIELQNQFADFVKKINKQKLGIQKSLEEMKKLQESLMNKYFGD